MTTTLLIIIGIIVVAIILITWFCKSMLDLADEVAEKKAERRKRQRFLHDLSVLLHEEEFRNSHQEAGKNAVQPFPDQGIDPSTIAAANIYASGVAIEQQIAEHMNIAIAHQQEEDFRRSSTGYEFGGTNCDPNLNPAAHFLNDEMMDTGSSWSDSFSNDAGWSDPFPDTSWDSGSSFDSSFDSGFNDPFGF